MMRLSLPMLCAAILVLPSVAGAQQALVPAKPVQVRPVQQTQPGQPIRPIQPAQPIQRVQPAPPDWFESNRASQVIQAQEQPHPAVRGQGGLGGAEAMRIYQNYIQGIGATPQDNSGKPSFGAPSGFGSNGSGYGGSQ
jgi:hypothetical protein